MSLMPGGGVKTCGFVYLVPQDSCIGLCYFMGHPENRALECMADKQISSFEVNRASQKARKSGLWQEYKERTLARPPSCAVADKTYSRETFVKEEALLGRTPLMNPLWPDDKGSLTNPTGTSQNTSAPSAQTWSPLDCTVAGGGADF